MMRNDLSEHCLCDKCSGYDCGADEETTIVNQCTSLARYTNEQLIEEIHKRMSA
jgi:hypothetical protein